MSGIRVAVLFLIVFQLVAAGQVYGNVAPSSIRKRSSPRTTESPVLPPGYVAFSEYGLAYKLFVSEVTHNEATSLCSNERGQLAVIDSREKVTNILSNFSSLQWAWVGLHRPQDTEGWVTIDGKSRNNLPWANGEPNGLGRCAYISRTHNGIVNNICLVKLAYLCEIALPRN